MTAHYINLHFTYLLTCSDTVGYVAACRKESVVMLLVMI